MNIKRKTSKKLKFIAILSAITVCSSISSSAIKSSAKFTIPKVSLPKVSFPSSCSNFLSRIPKVELSLGSFGKTLSNGFNKVKSIFTGNSSSKNVSTSSSSSSSSSSGITNKGFTVSEEDLTNTRNKLRPVSGTGSSTSEGSSSAPKVTKQPSKGIDKFYDGSFDGERKKYINDGSGDDGSDIYSTIVRNGNGDKITVRYKLGNEPEGRKPINVKTTSTGSNSNREYIDLDELD